MNIFHAEESGCDIVTVPNEFLTKLDLVGKDLAEYSRETVQAVLSRCHGRGLSDQDDALRRGIRRGNGDASMILGL